MMFLCTLFALSLVGDVVNTDPSDVEVQEVIFEEDIPDTPEEEEDLDGEEPE